MLDAIGAGATAITATDWCAQWRASQESEAFDDALLGEIVTEGRRDRHLKNDQGEQKSVHDPLVAPDDNRS